MVTFKKNIEFLLTKRGIYGRAKWIAFIALTESSEGRNIITGLSAQKKPPWMYYKTIAHVRHTLSYHFPYFHIVIGVRFPWLIKKKAWWACEMKFPDTWKRGEAWRDSILGI